MRAQESKELEKAAAAITSSILTTLPLMFVEMLRTGGFFITGSGKDGRGSLGDSESFEIYLIKPVPLGY